LADEPEPVDVLADSAYGSGQTLADLDDAGHTSTIKPWPIRPLTDAVDAFTIDDFDIDTAGGTATCPAGQTVTITARHNAVFGARCRDCPMRPRCTRAKNGKTLHIHDRHDRMAANRTAATDSDWQDRYRQHRPMVERTIAWLVARGHRRVRFRGITANQLWLSHRAAAVNLQRLLNLGLTHTSAGWALAPA
jgi:hypothetical protein